MKTQILTQPVSNEAAPSDGLRLEASVIPHELSLPEKVSAFLARAIPALKDEDLHPAQVLLPWACDVLASEHSVEGYGRDLGQFAACLAAQGVSLYSAGADEVRMYKAALLQTGLRPTTVARKLSVIRGAFREFARKGLVLWETAQSVSSIKAPPVKKNSTPALTNRQATLLLEAIPQETLQGLRDAALLQTFFITGCRVSAVVGACVGHLEFDGVEHYLHVTEKRNKRARKILLDAARPILAYLAAAGIAGDREGPLFRPLAKDGRGFSRRHLHRKTPWRLVKSYCRKAGVDPERLGGRGVGVHSLRKTAITDAIRNGAQMHEVREFAGHADIRTTELYYVRRDEDAEKAARKIQIRLPRRSST